LTSSKEEKKTFGRRLTQITERLFFPLIRKEATLKGRATAEDNKQNGLYNVSNGSQESSPYTQK
jgi:hypothetical protein